MEEEQVAQAIGVTKWFGETRALDDVDLGVRSGSIHALLGPNGAGKTTILAALLGLLIPDNGQICLFGRDRYTAGVAWLDRVAGFVEAPRFYPYLSGLENLQLMAALDRRRSHPDIAELLQLVGLRSVERLKVRGYSLGMRQRLALASTLLRDPDLMIIDEPTTGMDPAGARDIRQLLKESARQGRSVLLSSHDLAEVADVADTVTVLSHGRSLYQGGLSELQAQAISEIWHLATSDDTAAAAASEAVTNVRITARGDDGLLLGASGSALDEYVAHLVSCGIRIRHLAERSSRLEAAYLDLVAAASGEQS
jgi:ABC-2 type transport system ATP-binding protein